MALTPPRFGCFDHETDYFGPVVERVYDLTSVYDCQVSVGY